MLLAELLGFGLKEKERAATPTASHHPVMTTMIKPGAITVGPTWPLWKAKGQQVILSVTKSLLYH